ncbi:unnamed protein product [Dovyalis caffra]|uniref:Uncharacterized protein n=1 Tax=Dovyalis caffra TaxID=77055 RepID=A0AAV1S9L2_9ROSI|nr:unnamed protein product [Dovyalis caffra]
MKKHSRWGREPFDVKDKVRGWDRAIIFGGIMSEKDVPIRQRLTESIKRLWTVVIKTSDETFNEEALKGFSSWL